MFTILINLLIPLLITPTGTGKSDQSANKYVSYSVSVDKHSLKAGSKGTLLFTLRPQDGIHINVQPAPGFSFDTTSGIRSGGDLEISKDTTSGFLSKHKPIRQSFIIPRNVKTGKVTVKGTLTYFYCSDAEGWCSRFKQPVEATVEVVP